MCLLSSPQELVDVQNTQLDNFHLREQLDRMAHEIEQGKIIGSMHLDNNIHAQVSGAERGQSEGMSNVGPCTRAKTYTRR